MLAQKRGRNFGARPLFAYRVAPSTRYANSGTDCGVLCASGTRLAPTGVDTETRSTEQSV